MKSGEEWDEGDGYDERMDEDRLQGHASGGLTQSPFRPYRLFNCLARLPDCFKRDTKRD